MTDIRTSPGRVLVTGAAGFIGSHVVETMAGAGWGVRAFVRYGSGGTAGWLDSSPVRDGVEIFAGDIRDAGRVDAAVKDMDVVLHLAALIGIPYSYVAPSSYLSVNVEGTMHVLDAVRRHSTPRLVVTSTSEVYGSARYVPIDEQHPLQPQSPYSATKIASDSLALSYHAAFAVPVTVLRPFNTYGPRQSERAVIPTIIGQLLQGPQLRLGSLDPVRDLTFATDTARGFLQAATAADVEGICVNLGTGVAVSIGELVERIGRLLGVTPDIVTDPARVRPANSEVEQLLSANALAAAKLAWKPAVDLDEGLAQTIAFMRALPRRAAGYTI
jgi:NAD dependent epimerase/dehydratase